MEIIFMSENWAGTGDKMLLSSVTEKSWQFRFIKRVDKGRISTVRVLCFVSSQSFKFLSSFEQNASTPQGNEAISDDTAHALLSLSENVQTDEKLVDEQVDCKAAMETSLPRPVTEVTDTDPATGLVQNVRAIISQKANKTNILTGRPLKDMTGHTGYLTFATLYAQCKSSEAKCDEEAAE